MIAVNHRLKVVAFVGRPATQPLGALTSPAWKTATGDEIVGWNTGQPYLHEPAIRYRACDCGLVDCCTCPLQGGEVRI